MLSLETIKKLQNAQGKLDEFIKTINDNLGFQLSLEDAAEVYNSLTNYKKSKY